MEYHIFQIHGLVMTDDIIVENGENQRFYEKRLITNIVSTLLLISKIFKS